MCVSRTHFSHLAKFTYTSSFKKEIAAIFHCMACQRYRKFVFSQKNVIVKKKWSFGPTEEQAVLLRVAEMQSFAGAGNDKFTCKGKALQRIIQIIPSLRMGSSLRIL